MSLWDELLPRLSKVADGYSCSMREELQRGIAALNKFERDFQNGCLTFDTSYKAPPGEPNHLPSINEAEDEATKTPPVKIDEPTKRPSKPTERPAESTEAEPSEVGPAGDKPKKRSKEEMDEASSPEQEKRHKRNASVRAQGIISKQNQNDVKCNPLQESQSINVNLSSKMRREEAEPEEEGKRRGRKGRKNKPEEENKENVSRNLELPMQVKQEKLSVPAEDVLLMQTDTELPLTVGSVQVKQEAELMPPPPVRVLRKQAKEKSRPQESEEPVSRRSTRARGHTDSVGQTLGPATRRTRASSRTTSQVSQESQEEEAETGPPPPPVEPRPKRTRAKKQPDVPAEPVREESAEIAAPPGEKPRPKRTRKAAQKASSKEEDKVTPVSSPTQPRPSKILKKSSPITREEKKKLRKSSSVGSNVPKKAVAGEGKRATSLDSSTADDKPADLEETRLIVRESGTGEEERGAGDGAGDTTVVLHHTQSTSPQKLGNMNETVVLEAAPAGFSERTTMVLEKAANHMPAMDETVVINKDRVASDQITNDDSLLTEDDSEEIQDTPPRSQIPVKMPTSAVKERVQQFEELATRVTRTKTRALAKKQSDDGDTKSPPSDNPDGTAPKGTLTAATLAKLNNLPTAYRPNQISSSASKTRANIVTSVKSFLPASTSKITAIAKAKEQAEEHMKREKEDARTKKEALLEAKREEQKRRREQKIAAAAAVREVQAREYAARLEASARERQEKQAQVNQGKMELLKEAERKKALQERKLREAEERRRADEAARQARLEDEQRKTEAARRKQQEDAETMKKEELRIEREMQQARQQYLDKEKERERQKMLLIKQRMDADKTHTPLKSHGTHAGGTPSGKPPPPLPPVHMEDGFQYLCSDESGNEDEKPKRPPPDWSRTRPRLERLAVQALMPAVDVDKLFSVRRHTPDLRELFPGIERRRLVRTSSAVWRTPPRLDQLPEITE